MDMQNIALRRITAADDGEIAAIIRASLESYGLNMPGTAYFDPELDHLSAYYCAAPDRRAYFIAEVDGRVLGGAGLAEFTGIAGCAELQKLYLADAVRGMGLGRRLMQAVEEEARRLGYDKIHLETHSALKAAIGLYEKLGFEKIDRPACVKHGTMDCFYMKNIWENADEAALDERFMRMAIELSKAAVEHGNEPFGAVLVRDGKIAFTNENQIRTRHDPTFHGEAGLIREFCGKTGVTDLSQYTMYSSCEPCFMCSGAMVWARLGRLVYAASNMDLERIFGETGCECAQLVFEHSSWKPKVTAGVLREESLEVLQNYFGSRTGK